MDRSPVPMRSDKRYKIGNVKKVNGVLRGHPETMKIEPMKLPHNTHGLPFDLNPPLVVTNELAAALKKEGVL